MNALDGISINSKISLIVAGLIMMTFFTVQTCIVFGICEPTLFLAKFGWGCVVFFMPPFFKVVQEFLVNKQMIRDDLKKKNIYLEHAAKIIRHDMHSGINTYMPRGLTSLKRRITNEDIQRLKIQAPLKMLEEGLRHTQKVYLGVKEFTNLIKEDAQLDKKKCNLTEILKEYLKSTSYIKQVKIDNLPSVLVNEPLFCTAIDNLIRNGLKYNDSSTKFVSIYMQDNDHLCIEDNGRGMSQSEFNEYSKPYTRKKGQEEQGTGLGLNICLAILKEHGFSIRAEKKEQGTKLLINIKQ